MTTDMFLKIPYPKEIPAFNLFGLEGFPDSATDRYILDFFYGHEKQNLKNVESPILTELISRINKNEILSDPLFIGKESSYHFFACMNVAGELIAMQSKYYQYFKGKYPGCCFVSSSKSSPIGVTYNNDLVGIFMPLQLTEKMYNNLCRDVEVFSLV